MAATVWTGSISFGLVAIPVKLFTGVRDHDISFHQYNRDTGARIRYRKVDADSGDEVDSNDIIKGWDADDGSIVLVEPDELDDLDPDKSELLDILDFVELEQIDPAYYDRPYNVVPAGEAAAKAYRLLVEAMSSARKVAIARLVMRNKEHLAALRVRDGLLVLSTMRFHDEVVDPSGAEGAALVGKAEVRERELAMASQLIESLTTDFDPTAYADEHQARIMEFLEAKAEGQSVEPRPKQDRGRVIDLTAALEQSLSRRDARRDGADHQSQDGPTEDELDSMSKDELYDLAQERDLNGRSSMTKEELLVALRAQDAAA